MYRNTSPLTAMMSAYLPGVMVPTWSVLNRLKVGYWGNSICKVVYSKDQFSWTKSKKLRNSKVRGENWEESYHVALSMINGIRVRNLETALFYHADYINPFWKLSESKIAKIGKHIFYERAEGSWLAVE
jgi:spore germination cell wall hydrolase CwlJ-like protein